MSHPEGISVLLRRKISRMRRRMRFRITAPPRAFFTLIPNRLARAAPHLSADLSDVPDASVAPCDSGALAEEPACAGFRPVASFNGADWARKKTENWELDRRWPAPYTASYSTRFKRRMARGNPSRGSPGGPAGGPAPAGKSGSLDGRETMASFSASGRQHLAAPFGLHARAESVGLVAAAHFRLKRTFRQRTLPLSPVNWTESKRKV